MNTIKSVSIYSYFLVLAWLLGFTTLAYTQKLPDNILKNGDFDLKLDGWHHWTHESAAAVFQT